MKDIILINENDNVVVALHPLKKGMEVNGIVLLEDIEQGHKLAIRDIKENEDVIKYGSPIGHATRDIKKGEHVHIHNLKTNLNDVIEYSYNKIDSDLNSREAVTFKGYLRKNGRVGIRNSIWIIPTVGCVNGIVENIKRQFEKDDVIAYRHPYGCSQMGDDQENTRQFLANLINHPNAGGVLVVGLGCENSSIAEIKKHYPEDADESRIRYLVCQEVEDEIEAGVKLVKELLDITKDDERVDISADKLIVGLKCGGSDGLSGICANPAVGAFSDILCSMGGTTILTEVPEMFGAEQLLMNRCKNEEVFNKTVKLIDDFKNYFKSHNQTIYENPSPGNKAGGISSLEDKSLGCTQKSGTSTVNDVLMYGETVKEKGLNLLSAPGNDLVASSALAISGCHLVLFTTGRGTPFASPVPTLKISSNSPLYNKKNNWIDFNAGDIANGAAISDKGEELFKLVIDVASGKEVKSEINSYQDLAIFKQGVTL